MLLTIEKVAILQGVDIFTGTPGYLLAAVAQIIEEVELEPGHTFIEEGALEDCVYIVVDGEVRVHSNDQTRALIGAGQTVGELAVLDPEPRSASVSAVGHVHLFRIAKEPFDEVMADRPEIAQAVIRALTRRIREQGRYALCQSRSTGKSNQCRIRLHCRPHPPLANEGDNGDIHTA